MKRELGREDATVIATGGLAGIVADSTDAFDVVDGQLTIKASAKSTAACRSWGKTGLKSSTPDVTAPQTFAKPIPQNRNFFI